MPKRRSYFITLSGDDKFSSEIFSSTFKYIRKKTEEGNRDFLGGPVVKNPPANGGDRGSSPGPGRSHMPQSN